MTSEQATDREELLDLIQDMFAISCHTAEGYNHWFVSSYITAQRILLNEKRIDITSCVHKE